MASANTQQLRDELGKEPTIQPVAKVKIENIFIPSITQQTTQNFIGHSWIVGSSTNGIVGTNTSTADGQQQVVGSAGVINTVLKVVNDNNTYFELLNNTTFKDTSNTTGTWDGTGSAIVTASKILQSLGIWKDTGTCVSATIKVTIASGTANISRYLSSDGGSNFESVSDNVEHNFTNKVENLGGR